MKIARLQKIPELWKKLGSGSINSRIFGAAMIVGLGTIFVKLLAIVKELVVAAQFGTTADLDAFLIALTIPSFVLNIIAGSFNSALIPTYIKVREQSGLKSAQQLFAGATIWSIGLLLIATLLMLVTIPVYLPALTNGFSADKLALTYHLLWAISPMLLLTGIGSIWGAVLNAGERFALVALAPMITPVVTMILLYEFQSWGVFNLVAGMVGGQLLEMLVIGVLLQRQGFSLLPKWYGFNEQIREVASQYAPAIVGSFLMCSTGLVDRSMAAMLPSGSVASLEYGSRIVTLPIIIASTALSTAIMPYFSKMVASDDWQSIRHSLKQYLLLIFVASVPLTGAIVLFSEPIVRLLLQRGSFTAADTQIVAQIQSCFALQIPFYIGCMLLVRLISALRKNQILIVGSAFNLAINIGLNYLFMRWLGVAGIALSTSFVYIFSFGFLLIFVLRNLDRVDNLGLSTDRAAQIARVHQSKIDRINTILTPPQQQVFQQILQQRQSRPQSPNGGELSVDRQAELAAIRQAYMQRFREILTPIQAAKLDAIVGWQHGISLAKIDRLQLTSDQKARVSQLWHDERQEMDTLLTPEQQAQTQSRHSHRRAIEQSWHSLNLTPAQKEQMRTIRQEHKQKLNEILTVGQQAKIKNGNGKDRL
jgi:putative peptidoglycan lipid II flippase